MNQARTADGGHKPGQSGRSPSRAFKVLDVSAGNRAIWFDKQYPDAVYVDIRPEMNPDIVADSRMLPAEIGDDFSLVVFDPPHKNNGPNFGMARSYGCFDHEHIRSTISNTAKEAHRITRDDALMAFKWNDHSIKLTKIVGLLSPYWEPLFGHGVSHQQRSSSTSWVMLRRRDALNPPPLKSHSVTDPSDSTKERALLLSKSPAEGGE